MYSSRPLLGIGLVLLSAITACAPGASTGDEPLGKVQNPVFANGSFETGAVGAAPPSWTVQTFLNNGITVQTPQTRAGLNLAAGGHALTTIVSGTNQPDPDLGAGATLRFCRYGTQCARVNFHSNNANGNPQNVNSLSQNMVIDGGDVDPTDGQVHIRFTAAPVLQNPGHVAAQQPYYFVQVTNVTTSTILYTDFNLSAQAGVPWKTVNGGANNEIDYIDWSLVDVAPGPSKITAGDTVRVEVIAAGCSPNGHFGTVYVDGVGTTVPGLFVSGTGPTQVNAGTLVTYNMRYKNGSASPASGVVVNLKTPPNTTFQSITPPANATCTSPAIGAAGTVTCTVTGSVAAGAFDTFPFAVNLAGAATGQLVFGDYDIHSAQETTLVGSKIVSTIGCSTDAVCSTGKWCNISGNQCVVTLANGTSLPSDAPHTNPTLNGTCSASAGTLVCTSAVCDVLDNKCGKLNGSGTCTVTNQATVCRSGVCDADGSCGYATNDGPCSAANAATVCRSGSCSSNLLCQPAGGCNVDADCSGGQWCSEATHTCTPQLSNGTSVPTDTPHVNPTLNGTCTAAAGALVCAASVCDATDNKCGYATNSGPCTAPNAATVCRSATCSANGLCRPLGGCNVDADCGAGLWCAEATHACTAKLSNGTSIPTDAPHANPTLNGACSFGSGALVCQASVCDVIDDKCGKLNGSGACTLVNQGSVCRSAACDVADGLCGYGTNHGPCTALNGATVCRSGSCSANSLCQPAGGCNVDADCTSGQWCNETSHSCSLKLSNGTSIPTDAPHTAPTLNGTCSAPAATLVCESSVCDSGDDKCGFDVNGGPCTAGSAQVVCRSGSCSTNNLCKPVGGCNVDTDCTSGNWCNEALHACTATLANNTPLPTDVSHDNPTLNGSCTGPVASLVCQSAVCDAADDRCGYDNGHGPCTAASGAVVCRSGACSVDGTCRPANGCNDDADCSAGNWCEKSTNTCRSKLENGASVATDPPHTKPALTGKCSDPAATLVCQSAVCDTADDRCGFALGHGPCTALSGPTVCRSGSCSMNGLCQPAAGCNIDADCAADDWCNQTLNACLPKLGNGVGIPTDAPHASPTLNGSCTAEAASLVCTSRVCDWRDDECGFADGLGPCTEVDAASVCRSGRCGAVGVASGTCVACTDDTHCSGDVPVCNSATGRCVSCLTSANCRGSSPICNTDASLCVRCGGDKGGAAANPCYASNAPFCFAAGANAGRCGKCTTNTDCAGHTGNSCDARSGLCVTGCTKDVDCASTEWCNDSTRKCTPKLANGKPLPSEPTRVASCTKEVGNAVCVSSVCEASDQACGFPIGAGPCHDSEQCREGTCNLDTNKCSGPGCSSDAECASSEYCTSDAACAPLLPTGAVCSASTQCKSRDCYGRVCAAVVASGNGVACTLSAPGGSSNSAGTWFFGLLLGLAALARRQRPRAA